MKRTLPSPNESMTVRKGSWSYALLMLMLAAIIIAVVVKQ
jgi:hypothetical protein